MTQIPSSKVVSTTPTVGSTKSLKTQNDREIVSTGSVLSPSKVVRSSPKGIPKLESCVIRSFRFVSFPSLELPQTRLRFPPLNCLDF
ncbi:hypothetical protein CDAR_401131 [Caerostris darwini]|uniref:Uncharacterized protein n=1 Tax=Caerostris darwini TaxID=1538125 RepID=A0AAV4TL07_9ARAC|nr:hypothetical protein CDAR_401131 [Caerostris darwini]